MNFDNDEFRIREARSRDAADPLRSFRSRFHIPYRSKDAATTNDRGERDELIYLDGNSLGAMPVAVPQLMDDVIRRQWGTDLIRSWNDNGWIEAPSRIGSGIAELLGARSDEVLVADSVSVNLFKLLTALLSAQQSDTRRTILCEAGSFPTDTHVASGVARLTGCRLMTAAPEDLAASVDDQTAVILLSHIHYRTGARWDMAGMNRQAARHSVPVLWDLSHSIGAVPLNLPATGTQYAVGCGYKYLNGGPGAPAFLYAASDCLQHLASPLQGWMGHADPFAFEDSYRPAAGIERFLAGTPPILSMAALEAGVRLSASADMQVVWTKSCELFDLLTELVAEHCGSMELITPTKPAARGSHASFRHPHAWPINKALIARGVIGDFRTPDVLRLGLTPLYTRFEDVAQAVRILSHILKTEEWRRPEYQQTARVT